MHSLLSSKRSACLTRSLRALLTLTVVLSSFSMSPARAGAVDLAAPTVEGMFAASQDAAAAIPAAAVALPAMAGTVAAPVPAGETSVRDTVEWTPPTPPAAFGVAGEAATGADGLDISLAGGRVRLALQ